MKRILVVCTTGETVRKLAQGHVFGLYRWRPAGRVRGQEPARGRRYKPQTSNVASFWTVSGGSPALEPA